MATGAEVVALVQEDRLVARSEEAVFQWVRRWWEAGARPEAELLAVLRLLRFATMAEGFLRETVGAWPGAALRGSEGRALERNATLSQRHGVPRSGFGPRLRRSPRRSASTVRAELAPSPFGVHSFFSPAAGARA